MPADVIIGSPWFPSNGIHRLEDAVTIMRAFIEREMDKQDIGLVSMSMMSSMKEGSLYGSVEQHRRRMNASNDALSNEMESMSMSIDDYKQSSFMRRDGRRNNAKKRDRK